MVHKGDGEEVSRIVNGAELAESLDDEPLALRHNVEDGVGLCQGPAAHLEGAGAVSSSSPSSRGSAAAHHGKGRAGVAVEGVEGGRGGAVCCCRCRCGAVARAQNRMMRAACVAAGGAAGRLTGRLQWRRRYRQPTGGQGPCAGAACSGQHGRVDNRPARATLY